MPIASMNSFWFLYISPLKCNLPAGEAIKDAVEAEAKLVPLEAEAAVLEGVEAVGDSPAVGLVHLVSTAAHSGVPGHHMCKCRVLMRGPRSIALVQFKGTDGCPL